MSQLNRLRVLAGLTESAGKQLPAKMEIQLSDSTVDNFVHDSSYGIDGDEDGEDGALREKVRQMMKKWVSNGEITLVLDTRKKTLTVKPL